MGDIKTAAEIAMEKVEKLGKATEEERLRWKYVPEGEKLAVKYLRSESNLAVDLNHYEENVRKYIAEGAQDILIRNITLPRDERAEKNTKRAIDGIKALKKDKVRVENIYSNLRRIFNHYLEQGKQQKQQAYESLKADFEARLKQAVQQQQLGPVLGLKIDVERQPQFQEEWRRLQSQLESQYIKLLDEYKEELSEVR